MVMSQYVFIAANEKENISCHHMRMTINEKGYNKCLFYTQVVLIRHQIEFSHEQFAF